MGLHFAADRHARPADSRLGVLLNPARLEKKLLPKHLGHVRHPVRVAKSFQMQEGDQTSAVPAEAAEEQEEFDREAVARGRRSAHQEWP